MAGGGSSRGSAEGRHRWAEQQSFSIVVGAHYEAREEEMGQFYSHLLLGLRDSSLEGGRLTSDELLTLN